MEVSVSLPQALNRKKEMQAIKNKRNDPHGFLVLVGFIVISFTGLCSVGI